MGSKLFGRRVWNGFVLRKVRGEIVPCRFCWGADDEGHPFLECTYPPLVQLRENLNLRS